MGSIYMNGIYMKKIFFLMVLIAIFSISCKKNTEEKPMKSTESQNENTLTHIGSTSRVYDVKAIPNEVPLFSWYTENGQKTSIMDYKGKIIIINFWATWCSPCRNEIPVLVKTYHKYKERGLVMLGICLDQDISLNDLAAFVGENELNYQVVFDNGMLESGFGGISAIPTTFILSKDLKVLNKYVGEMDEERMNKLLEGLF
jgi:cytochrome c-type biogenesis protein